MCKYNMELGVLSIFTALQVVVTAQTAVYVKFLTPPHGYTHNLHLSSRGGHAVTNEQRIYPGAGDARNLRYQQDWYRPSPLPDSRTRHGWYQPPAPPPPPQPTSYYYPRPAKPFDEYGPPARPFQGDRPPEEHFLPNGEYHNPAYSQHQSEMVYDPLLITGPQAAQYVAYLFSRGELFFHLIPHERLVLMNQRDRIANNLVPHILASIRPGHPFFLHR